MGVSCERGTPVGNIIDPANISDQFKESKIHAGVQPVLCFASKSLTPNLTPETQDPHPKPQTPNRKQGIVRGGMREAADSLGGGGWHHRAVAREDSKDRGVGGRRLGRGGGLPWGAVPDPQTPDPKPYTLNPTPYTLNPTPSTLHPTPSTLHPQPYTIHPKPYTLNPTP